MCWKVEKKRNKHQQKHCWSNRSPLIPMTNWLCVHLGFLRQTCEGRLNLSPGATPPLWLQRSRAQISRVDNRHTTAAIRLPPHPPGSFHTPREWGVLMIPLSLSSSSHCIPQKPWTAALRAWDRWNTGSCKHCRFRTRSHLWSRTLMHSLLYNDPTELCDEPRRRNIRHS